MIYTHVRQATAARSVSMIRERSTRGEKIRITRVRRLSLPVCLERQTAAHRLSEDEKVLQVESMRSLDVASSPMQYCLERPYA